LVIGSNLWFKFYSARWLGSEDVMQMSATERGVYISLMAAYHQYGPLPSNRLMLARLLQIDYRTIAKWLQKWANLVVSEQSSPVGYGRETLTDNKNVKLTLPKFNDFCELQNKPSHKKERIERKERKSEGQDLQPLSKDEERENAERVFKQLMESAEGRALAEVWK
jgi:hypothetical protein